MIHLVGKDNRHLFKAQLEEMHQLRRVHFVDERGWSQMNVRDGGEYDDSDDDRTLYFLALDEDGQVGVSMRARPTDDKCIVADVFPQLIHGDVASCKSPQVWEISRIFSTRRFRTRSGLRRRDEVFLASMEAAVDHGVTRLVGIIDTYLLPQAMRFPWNLKPLGLPAAYPEGEMIGVDIPVSRDLLQDARESLAIEGSIIADAAPRSTGVTEAEIYELLKAQRLPPEALTAFADLVRDAAALQDKVSEDQLLAMIDRLAAQWRGKQIAH
jgi:acyl-homoserine lactone synthase